MRAPTAREGGGHTHLQPGGDNPSLTFGARIGVFHIGGVRRISCAATGGPAILGGMALLEATAIAKSFAGVQALRGVSFTLRSGEVHALLGENGAVKSTLIKVITGAEKPDSGTLAVDGPRGAPHSRAAARALAIAAFYQHPALFPE